MTILKKIFLALAIVSSMGVMATYSSVASAAEAQKSGKEIINEILNHLGAALKAINTGENKEVVEAHVKNARQISKELSVGALASRVMFAADTLVYARKAIRNDDMTEAKKQIKDGLEQYEALLPDVL